MWMPVGRGKPDLFWDGCTLFHIGLYSGNDMDGEGSAVFGAFSGDRTRAYSGGIGLKIVIVAIINSIPCSPYIEVVISACKMLAASFPVIAFAHVGRKTNMLEHTLASVASSFPSATWWGPLHVFLSL